MAINRQDYQYIKSTIPTNSYESDDGSLKVGSKITNLAVDLSPKNVFNVFYPTYYTNKTLFDGWSAKTDSSESKKTETVTVSLPIANASSTERANLEYDTKTETSTLRETLGQKIYTHIFHFDLSWYITSDNTGTVFWNYQTDGLVTESMNWNSGILTVTAKTLNHTETINLFVVKKTGYRIKFNILINQLDLEDYDTSSQIISASATGDNMDKYTWEGNTITIEYLKETLTDCSANVTVEYDSFNYTDTVQKGTLIHKVKLKKNTSYVLQVIDSVLPKNIEKFENKITFPDNNSFSFNQYLFFRTPNTNSEIESTLEINGIGFSYKILGLSTSGVVDLRSIKTSEQARVFLFQADKAWVVNKQGSIVGLKDEPLKIIQTTTTQPSQPILSKNEIKEIFSKPPQLTITTNTNNEQVLKVLLPDSDGSGTWKYYPEWKITKDGTNSPKIMDNLRLLVYRDFLVDTPRKYNEQEILVRRGLVKILSRTNIGYGDTYATVDLNSDNQYTISGDGLKIDITHPFVQIGENTTSLNFTFKKDEERTYTQCQKEEQTSTQSEDKPNPYTIDLFLMSLFGYNWKYSYDNNLLGLTNSPAYKYTSFCFAWGYGEGKTPNRISDFSAPIIIDRKAVETSKNEDGSIKLKGLNCELKKAPLPGYYAGEVIQLVTTTTNSTSE